MAKSRKRKITDDVVKIDMCNLARRRAREKGLPYNIYSEDIVVPEICPILKIPLFCGKGAQISNSPNLDRIIPKLGYVLGNIQVISHRANRIKYDATLEELKSIVQYVEEYMPAKQRVARRLIPLLAKKREERENKRKLLSAELYKEEESIVSFTDCYK